MIVAHPFDTFGTMEGGFPTAQPLGGVGRDYSPLVQLQKKFRKILGYIPPLCFHKTFLKQKNFKKNFRNSYNPYNFLQFSNKLYHNSP